MKEKIYILEVGVKEHCGGDFVENEIVSYSIEKLKEYGLNYVLNGVDKTYYKIYEQEIDILSQEDKEIIENFGYCDNVYNNYIKVIDELDTTDIEDLRPYYEKEVE